jgi:hypothetical protein
VASRKREFRLSDISDEESANYHRELLFYLLFILVFAGSPSCILRTGSVNRYPDILIQKKYSGKSDFA